MSFIQQIIFIAYFFINLSILSFLAFYDMKYLLLNKILYYIYIPISLLSVVPNIMYFNLNIKYVLVISLISAFVLYGAFFLVGLLTHNKLGGGDVKLIPFIAFSFGPYMVQVLLLMAFSLLLFIILDCIKLIFYKIKKVPKEQQKIGPYPAIPFMFIGCLITMSLIII